jgi:nucleotidyltransferase/DNA polymerase involved in DNA repair
MSYSYSSTVPIEMLPGIGRRTAKVLRSMHVRTVGQFKVLPERMLVEIFGPSIRSLYQHVHGTAAKSVTRIVTPNRWKTTMKKQPLKLSQKFRLATQVFMM